MVDAPGTRIADKYELLQPAGTGGMATVWRAIQYGAAGFSRPVGIKRIRPDLAHQRDFVKMFIEEARVCAQLMHPNIVQIFDFGYDRGNYFLVMEWVDGLNLGRYLNSFAERGLTPAWHLLAAIAIESLHALGAAHNRVDQDGLPAPVYHRDVTPPNILIGVNGIVKLSDFGLARAMDRSSMTSPDIVKGKLGYLAPELTYKRGPTAQTDLYSLGVVLWQALAGRQLFAAENLGDVLLKARKREIPPLEDERPDLPPELVRIVHRALERKPERRFLSAREMSRELAALLRQHPEPTDARQLSLSVTEARAQYGLSPPSLPPPPMR
ncbi:MAG: serine/threonine protein kinase [Deltaproteobacteria bacterium]|nr:serine/threonine protein kinase [Deltaproteobacteria bacterium]MBW2536669.1 serine/threonine protein kinase [Deltaproteobacteria bacterium]